MTCNLKIENLQPQFGCFWNVNTIQRLCSTQHIITRKRCIKCLVSLPNQFLLVKTKLDANSLFLNVRLSTGLQRLQNVLSTNTHKCQLHKNAAFCYSDIAQILNKLTGQYIALHSSIVCIWLAPKVASLETFSLHPTIAKSAAGVIILHSIQITYPTHYNDRNNRRQLNITHLLARQAAFFLYLFSQSMLKLHISHNIQYRNVLCSFLYTWTTGNRTWKWYKKVKENLFAYCYSIEIQNVQDVAKITPTFWRSIKIKLNKVHKKLFYL